MNARFEFSRRPSSLFVAIVVVAAVLGCGKRSPSGQVRGKLTLAGAPVAAGNKIFFERSGKGQIAAGVVGEGGIFELNLMGSPDIPLGTYRVFVGPPDSNMTQQEFYELKTKVDAEYRSQGKTPPPSPDWVLPVRYYDPMTSRVDAVVKAGANVVDIDLEP